MEVTILLTLFFGALVSYILYFKPKHKKSDLKHKTPPEVPGSLPIFGHLLYLGTRPHEKLIDWAKKYGTMFIVNFGSLKTLIVDDPILMNQIFSENAFSGRIQSEVFHYQSESHGVAFSEGETWETQRRFTLKHLRDLGFKRNFMENLIMNEVQHVLKIFKDNANKPFPIINVFTFPVLNSLWVLTTGQQIPHEDSILLNLHTNYIKAFNKLATAGGLFAPGILHLAPSLSGWNTFKKTCDYVRNFIKETVKEHEKTFDENNLRDLIDSYLHEIKKTEDVNSQFYKDKGYTNLYSTVIDLFNAGAETTSTTLNWAMLYLTKFQEVQEKVYQEILSVVGNSRKVSLVDRPNLPYTEATIREVLRKSSLLPLGIMHRTLFDKVVNGILIKKGTLITGNLYSAHHNKSYWTNPNEFNPSRFLSSDGKTLISSPAFVPFLSGRRRCPGDNFAMETLFLFITSIVQNFKLTSYNEEKLDLFGKPGFVLNPKPFNIQLQSRL